MTVRIGSSLLLSLVGVLVFACTAASSDDVLVATRPDASAPIFVDSDGGSVPDASGIVGLCPSAKCPPGHATCPHSQFPCTDLRSDDDNCGACGNVCPQLGGGNNLNMHGAMQCVDGQCKLSCDVGYANCNGLVEDGCEANLVSNESCGECGAACPANHACLGSNLSPTCECTIYGSCGACGNLCPENTEPPFPPEWNASYDCRAGECNKPGCQTGYQDCNGDFDKADGNGCETNTFNDPLNCGGCGTKCLVSEGEICESGRCICRCGAPCSQTALDTDVNNCGACGFACPEGEYGTDDHASRACTDGVCGFRCAALWGDCDGKTSNGCETNLGSDPQNCGACGARCDAVEGQACVDGRCTTEECTIK